MKLQNHGTVQGTGPGRAAVGTRFQSPTQMTWSSVAGRVPASGAAPVGKAVAQELSDDRMA